MMSSMSILGWLWPTLIVIGLVLVVVGAAALMRRRRPSAARGPTARAVLDARYARGEIDDAEYQRRREQLS